MLKPDRYLAAALAEFARILKPGGVVVFKCQDTVQSGKQVWNHVFILQAAEQHGFVAEDLLILRTPQNRRVRGHNWGDQQHAWRTHCYFWVFTKGKRRKRARAAGAA
jgi:ubiquinone/menaquinone biosynthesis C-methylase UbiE